MSEEEKDILVRKKKYWAKVMKNNVKYTIVCVIYIIGCLLFIFPGLNYEEQANIDIVLVLVFYLSLLYIPSCWFLLFVMYGYHRMGIFKIDKITKPQPDILSKSQGMTVTQITSIKEAKELLDQKIITNSEFDKIKNEYSDEEVVTRLRGIADLRDSGVLTEDEFQEQKSKILSETPSQSNDNLSFKDFKNISNASLGKGVVVGIVVGVIILILIISLFSFLGGSVSTRAYVEGTYASGYEMCWSGAFHNGDSIISISGCGTETFHCSDEDFCSINAQKDEDNSHELCVRIGSKEACTKAAYGIAQV
jgi:hypothetical protein